MILYMCARVFKLENSQGDFEPIEQTAGCYGLKFGVDGHFSLPFGAIKEFFCNFDLGMEVLHTPWRTYGASQSEIIPHISASRI